MIDENLLSLDHKLTQGGGSRDERKEGPQILIDIGRNSAEDDSEHDFD